MASIRPGDCCLALDRQTIAIFCLPHNPPLVAPPYVVGRSLHNLIVHLSIDITKPIT
jgi:hypothetical protein